MKHWKKKIRNDRKNYFIKQTTYNEWTPVVLSILVLEENVNDSGGQGVEEGEDGDGDEELCRGRGVPNQGHLLSLLPLAGGHLEGHLVQPKVSEIPERGVINMPRRESKNASK